MNKKKDLVEKIKDLVNTDIAQALKESGEDYSSVYGYLLNSRLIATTGPYHMSLRNVFTQPLSIQKDIENETSHKIPLFNTIKALTGIDMLHESEKLLDVSNYAESLIGDSDPFFWYESASRISPLSMSACFSRE